MKLNLLFLLAGFTLTFSSRAQEARDTVFWRESPTFINLAEEELAKNDALILTDNRRILYISDYCKVTRHKIIHINTKEGLDDHNKIVIYISSGEELIELKARSISSSGEVIELNKKNIKEIENYTENGDLKAYAIEGAEVGGQIEYSYTLLTPVYSAGTEEFSMAYPSKHAYFVIKSYGKYDIDSKAYNWENKESLSKNERHYIFENILPIEDEEYSAPESNRVFIDYKVLGYSYKGSYAETIYTNYGNFLKSEGKQLTTFTSPEKQLAKSIIEKFIGGAKNEQDSIFQMNTYLKKNFFFEDGYTDQLSTAYFVMKHGKGNDLGLTKLYCLILTELEISYSVLMSCDKYENWFDKSFCTPSTLSEYVIYFPQFDSYLYPSDEVAHYGLIPYWLEGNTAIKLYKTSPAFVELPSQHPDSSRTQLTIAVDLNLLENYTTFEIDAYGTGQIAYDYNALSYYSESEEEEKSELKDLVSWRYPDAEIVNVEKVNPEYWGDIGACKDYACMRQYKATVKSASFFENLGNKILVHVGKLIGPQTELYSAVTRVQPITCDHNKSYGFEISIKIPEGYKYAGHQNAEIDNEFKDEKGERIAGFKSTLTVVDGYVKISIYESYGQVNIDKKYYEDYRRIINSAADFNKATLLFEKI